MFDKGFIHYACYRSAKIRGYDLHAARLSALALFFVPLLMLLANVLQAALQECDNC